MDKTTVKKRNLTTAGVVGYVLATLNKLTRPRPSYDSRMVLVTRNNCSFDGKTTGGLLAKIRESVIFCVSLTKRLLILIFIVADYL